MHGPRDEGGWQARSTGRPTGPRPMSYPPRGWEEGTTGAVQCSPDEPGFRQGAGTLWPRDFHQSSP